MFYKSLALLPAPKKITNNITKVKIKINFYNLLPNNTNNIIIKRNVTPGTKKKYLDKANVSPPPLFIIIYLNIIYLYIFIFSLFT